MLMVCHQALAATEADACWAICAASIGAEASRRGMTRSHTLVRAMAACEKGTRNVDCLQDV